MLGVVILYHLSTFDRATAFLRRLTALNNHASSPTPWFEARLFPQPCPPLFKIPTRQRIGKYFSPRSNVQHTALKHARLYRTVAYAGDPRVYPA